VVVVGNVLSRGNAEVEAVLDRQLHYVSLAEFLKDVVLRRRQTVAICGTHGKTTTTALTAHVLKECGLDPGWMIGGEPLGLAHSAHLNPDGLPFVIEGDEYDTAFFDKRAKFLHYVPQIAVVTSVEFDHGDIYRDLAEIQLAFQRMLRQVPQSGWLIACADNPAADLAGHAFSNVMTYGFSERASWRGEVMGFRGGLARMAVYHESIPWAEIEAPVAGRHNLQNALAAIAVADLLGASVADIVNAVRSFKGVRRRMEVFLERDGITFIDDFAHHPTAIRETIRAARERWPEGRLRVVFEPRSNTVVTNRFQEDMNQSFLGASEVFIGPIYRAAQIPEAERLDRAGLCGALALAQVPARWCDDVPQLARLVLDSGQPGDIVLILSNGAFGGIYELFRHHPA
jgi:UDP-N-acetylmuramate: L-alanyl-gamma-D-glutamyl-meso-diaminopimelate ligase